MNSTNYASQFKFLKMWTLHDSCKDLISNCWGIQIIGSPMFILSKKLKLLKEHLKNWNKEVFGNVHSYVKDAEDSVAEIQNQIQLNGCIDSLRDSEKRALDKLDEALKRQEWFWHEKSKVNWHVEGDRNTKYFHRIAKRKNTTKAMSSIRVDEKLITDPQQIADHVVNYYQNLFCANTNLMQDETLIEGVIPNIIDDSVNAMLTMIPTPSEIKNAVFDLNKEGAPGPDGFGAFFFHTYWDIIQHDVVNAVIEFFTTGYLMPNFNANTLILIPKNQNADVIEHYRPIAMANFKFKIISKVLADRLAQIMPTLISKEQRGFIHGRNIKDCLCLASEAANLLHSKTFGGNLALKIDITKAFDTLHWPFLLKVLKCFGFSETFCKWIDVILKSATLSISINGKMHGYFHCKRGVRQGDPLSPLLFCIAEDVLSRNITKLVSEGKLRLSKGSRNVVIPSHCFYADDIMVYCTGRNSNLVALKDLFTSYALASGQVVSAQKSTIYSGGISHSRLLQIAQYIGFSIGSLPFNYLGVPIFKGRPRVAYLQPVADKIKAKLAAWKASLLSIAGRIQLVKSVIQSMLIYSISIYAWPVSLLRDLERWIKNFIWSGDINQRKLVTVAWKKVCKPYSQGGLGVRSLITLNDASNLKLCWDLFNSQEQWAILLRSRTFRSRNCITHHIHSTIWSGVKAEFNVVLENSRFIIGDGSTVNFWRDTWCGDVSLEHSLQITDMQLLHTKVKEMIQNHQWHIPPEIEVRFPNLMHMLEHITIPLEDKPDSLAWKHSDSGDLTLRQAYLFKDHQLPQLQWAKTIWCKDIPPSKSLVAWRLMHRKLPTDENLLLRGCNLPSMCSMCLKEVESSFHLFFQCSYAVNVWNWFSRIIGLNLHFNSVEDIWLLCDRNWQPQCRIVILAGLVNIISTIWFIRNQVRFNNNHIPWEKAVTLISSNVSLSGNLTKLTYRSCMRDFSILKNFKVILRPPRAPSIKEVLWQPPPMNWMKKS
ncbi:ribonuclease H [Trifolium pratense]|uniref:Ribonuclease H n=1 Tax=Trifolium pratense TaxID=57577 RepID=A0A2K3NJF2_TRIPR|nr:ribonuclease H [Trifolium pratense]